MKFFIAATLCLALTAEAGYRKQGQRFRSCVSSGDPHYKPVHGKRHKFTMMGAGEFKLAQVEDFGVHSCQEDLTKTTRPERARARDITWNKHIVAFEGSTTVEVSNEGEVKVNGETKVTNVFAKGQRFTHGSKDGPVLVRKTNRRRAHVVIKFKSGRTLRVSHLNRRNSRFGTFKALNVNIRIEAEATETGVGLCFEKKGTAAHHDVSSTKFLDGRCGATTVVEEIAVETKIDELKTVCPKLMNRAFQACGNNKKDANDCVFDIVEGCTAADEEAAVEAEIAEDIEQAAEEKKEQEVEEREYTCPANSYVSRDATYPLTDFDDCDCIWGFEKKAVGGCDTDNDDCDFACVRQTTDRQEANGLTDNSNKPVSRCFCDPTAPQHCMQTAAGDKSCGVPVGIDGQACNDPLKAMDPSQCACARGTMDCSAKNYAIRELRAPGLAVPGQAFGQQPVFALTDNGEVEVGRPTDDTLRMRISIANVQPESCACAGDKPCKHNNVADNTCFAKQDLFGEQTCPAGTTECIAAEADVMLYRKDPNDASLERKDKECRHGQVDYKTGTVLAHRSSRTNFCSKETPCKQINDGTCMPKQTWRRPVVDENGVKDGPRPTKFCGIEYWRRATPSPVRGWFFDTDSTCNMDADAPLGCTDSNHRYAMDKWCDHNCQPAKYGRTGQPAFCPPSHCEECQEPAETPAEPEDGWRCPLDQYTDGSCFCSAGTEHCGAIEVAANQGVVVFEHLTIGTPGKYQLLVELVKADANTGSSIVVSTTSSVFEVRYPSSGAECRAQPQWRKDDLDQSPTHGAGKAWFFQDTSVKCTSYSADGSCGVAPKRVYAMDKWCKANRCAEHTLVSHCTKEATQEFPVVSCDKNVFDLFGDCCDSGRVDQCGVCDGDGSTCELSYYLSTFADEVDQDIIEQLKDDALAGRKCPVFAPCAHINVGDESCVPKTFNSGTLVNEDFRYCPYDEPALANWRRGIWTDEAGQISKMITYENGNKDCFCPDGTVDLSGKAKVEEKMEIEFKEEIVETVTETITRVENKVGTPTTEDLEELTEARITKVTQENIIKLHNKPCGGANKDQAPTGDVGTIEIADSLNHPLVAHAFQRAGLEAVQFKKGDVKCIELPGRCGLNAFVGEKITEKTTIDLETATVTRFINDAEEKKFVNVEATVSEKVEQVRCGGNINKVRAQVLGTPLSAAELTCAQTLKIEVAQFGAAFEAAKTCVGEGNDVKQCIEDHGSAVAAEARDAFDQFKTCVFRNKIVAQARAKAAAVKEAAARAAKALAAKVASKFKLAARVKSTGWFRRLATTVAAAPTGTQFIGRVGASGNTGVTGGAGGTSGTSFSSSMRTGTGNAGTPVGANFGSAPSAPAGTASGGLSAGMTALVALVSVGALVGAAVGVKKHRDGFTAGKPQSTSLEMAATGAGAAAKEDCTDVL